MDIPFFREHPVMVYLIVSGLLVIVGYLLKQVITDNKKELLKVANTAEEIERNYNKKFEKVHERIDESDDKFDKKFEEMMEKLNEIQLTNKDAYHSLNMKLDRQVTVCEMVQKAKK